MYLYKHTYGIGWHGCRPDPLSMKKIVFQLERMEQICSNQLFPPIQEWKRLSCPVRLQHKAEFTEIGSQNDSLEHENYIKFSF